MKIDYCSSSVQINVFLPDFASMSKMIELIDNRKINSPICVLVFCFLNIGGAMGGFAFG